MSESFTRLPFKIDFEGHVIKGDATSFQTCSGSTLLCLHGAGQSTRYLFDPIRSALFTQNISSAAFDFIGHGETGGCLQLSSLQHRLNQSCAVIDELNLPSPLSLMASSMSGYTAIKLLEKYPIAQLILIVPAVYHAEAHSVLFNQGFSEIIRRPLSWMHSDAWSILSSFKGDLLIIGAENDEVVPREILQKLYDSANLAKRKELYLVSHSPHKILNFLSHHPGELQKVNQKIFNILEIN